MAKAREQVARTSGARGLANRKDLRRLEAALRGLSIPEGDPGATDAAIQGHLSGLYEAVEPEEELLGRAEKVLLSLGFKPAMIQVRSTAAGAVQVHVWMRRRRRGSAQWAALATGTALAVGGALVAAAPAVLQSTFLTFQSHACVSVQLPMKDRGRLKAAS